MASLATHVNVWETCLQLLERKGFRLWVTLGEDETACSWFAERGGIDLQAEDPISLLGLAAIYEDILPAQHEPYWWSAHTRRDQRISDRLLEQAEEQERDLLRWRERPDWHQRVEQVWHECEGDLEDVADQLGVTVRVLKPLLKDMQLLS
jgi:hypothetical protein